MTLVFEVVPGVEQSVLGGVAHLLNFTGTDTLSAAYYAQFALNEGRPVGNIAVRQLDIPL